jgi:hypothetical protein
MVPQDSIGVSRFNHIIVITFGLPHHYIIQEANHKLLLWKKSKSKFPHCILTLRFKTITSIPQQLNATLTQDKYAVLKNVLEKSEPTCVWCARSQVHDTTASHVMFFCLNIGADYRSFKDTLCSQWLQPGL